MFLSHDKFISISKKNKISITSKDKFISIKLLKFIFFLKLIEEELEKNYHPADEMKCPIHFCHGQESVPAALYLLLTKNDYLFSHHRSHGYYLSKKCPPKKLFAELYGKISGANSGFAGSQDISFFKNKFYSGAILAGAVSIAVGTALSLKLNKKKNISVCGFGESATDQGIFWESLNYSSLNNLPILYICENNDLSVLTPQKNRQAGDSISAKSKSFGVKSIQVYGNDPLKVYKTIKNAIRYIKQNKKPFLVEVYVFRGISHVGPLSDDMSNLKNSKKYKFWLKNNSFENLKKILLQKKYINSFFLKKLESKIKKNVIKYFSYAKQSRFPKINNFYNFNFNNNLSKMQKKIKVIKIDKIFYDEKISQVKGY